MRKSRAQFLIFGRARLRELNGKPTHVLQLQGAILHHQLETMVQKKFSQEMGELFPAMCQFATENDLLAFELTASLISSVSRYIIGLASFLSGNIELAREQLETLERTLPNLGEGASPIQKIRSRLPMRLAGVYEAKATIEVHSWNLDRNLKHLDSARIALDAGLERNPNSYQMLLLSAICHFVLKRDLGAAVNAVRQCKDLAVRDGTWRFSYAFLLAYRGDYQQALQQYKAAFRSRYRPNIPIQVESFMLWVLEEEPERMELHYCLGMVNLHAKCDYVRAKEEFQAFLHKSGQSKSLRQWRGQASRYLAMIDAEIERGTLTQDDGVGASGSNEPRAPSEESSSPKRDSG
ncbi:MAG: hypothetical protein A49_04590 [Methyloceanibacter sp.]|nr:MAG: hypothetical protein A49_04590 [Methyloceanibacter sp.]